MNIFIDFETIYDNSYTLKKLNVYEYLTDPRFGILGCSYAIDNHEAQFVRSHQLKGFKHYLEDLTNNYEVNFIAHNMAFDGYILSQHWALNPSKFLCTLSMTRGKLALKSYSLASVAKHLRLPNKLTTGLIKDLKPWEEYTTEEQQNLATYARMDVELCRSIYKHLSPYPEDELELIDLTMRMSWTPHLQINIPKAQQLLDQIKEDKQLLMLEYRNQS
jgi:hypothetical protein